MDKTLKGTSNWAMSASNVMHLNFTRLSLNIFIIMVCSGFLRFVKPQGISLPTTTTTTPSPVSEGVCSLPSLNPCVPAATCTPSLPVLGEAICICPEGYAGDGKREDLGGFGCYDIDECLSGTHTCDPLTEACVNMNGGYSCTCASGYKLDNNGIHCIDINECLKANICGPETICSNQPGSYSCICLDPDRIYEFETNSCRPIDRCVDLDGTLNPCDQVCTHEGNDVTCSCYAGYELHTDNITCLDIDECTLGTNSCDPNGIISTCFNTEGAYRCECNDAMGYENAPDGRSCVNLDECTSDPNACGTGAMCCLDLDPPQRYACLVPGSEPSKVETLEPDINNYFQVLQRDTQKGGRPKWDFSLFNSHPSNDDHMYVRDEHRQPPIQYPPEQIDKLFPTSSYTGGVSNVRGSEHAITTRQIIENKCFKFETEYVDQNLYPVIGNVPYASSCQTQCIITEGCNYYSYNVATSECHLKATSFTPYYNPNYVSGPGDCSLLDDAGNDQKGLFSMGLTGLEPFQIRSSGGLLSRFLEQDHTAYNIIREGVLPAEMCGASSWDYMHCIVVGNLNPYEVESLTQMVVPIPYSFVTTSQEHHIIEPIKQREMVRNPYVLTGMSLTDYNTKKSLRKRELLKLGFDLGLGELLGTNGLSLYSNNIGVLDSWAPFNLFSPSCPEGYIYSPDIARDMRRDKTLDLARSFFVDEKNGTVTPKDPADLKNSLVSNTNYLANELARWYIEIASAPVDIATAAFVGTPTESYQNGTSGLILSDSSLPGGVVSTNPEGITEERKKLNSALLTTLGLLSVLGGTSGGGGLGRVGSRGMAYGFST